MVCRTALRWRSPDRSEPVAGDLPRPGGDGVGPGQCRERGRSAQPPRRRPAHQDLGASDRSNAGQFDQPWRDGGDERVERSGELGDLGVEGLDASGGGPQGPDGHAVPGRPGRAVPPPHTAVDLCGGRHAAQLGAQLRGRTEDERLELIDGSNPAAGGVASGPLAAPAALRGRRGGAAASGAGGQGSPVPHGSHRSRRSWRRYGGRGAWAGRPRRPALHGCAAMRPGPAP